MKKAKQVLLGIMVGLYMAAGVTCLTGLVIGAVRCVNCLVFLDIPPTNLEWLCFGMVTAIVLVFGYAVWYIYGED